MTNTATANTFPALTGDAVTERHVRTCRERGHATHTVDGVNSGRCPRCGDATAIATPQACYACDWGLRSHQHTCGA